MNIPEVKEAMEELTHMSADPETRAEYDARVREMNRIYAGQTVKYKEGLEKGRAEGEQIGEARGRAEERAKAEAEKKESARKALAIGLTVDQVASITGLSVEEIEALR